MLLLLLGTALILPFICATQVGKNHETKPPEATSNIYETLHHETAHHEVTNPDSGKRALAPEKIERIAQKLLKLTLNTSHVQVSHCIMHPDNAYQKDRKIHFHLNIISDVFIDMPIFVVSNTFSWLKSKSNSKFLFYLNIYTYLQKYHAFNNIWWSPKA